METPYCCQLHSGNSTLFIFIIYFHRAFSGDFSLQLKQAISKT